MTQNFAGNKKVFHNRPCKTTIKGHYGLRKAITLDHQNIAKTSSYKKLYETRFSSFAIIYNFYFCHFSIWWLVSDLDFSVSLFLVQM